MQALPYKKVYNLAEEGVELQWLVEGLWGESAVGILGGEPKCCKSFLALDLAVGIASGKPCLGQYVIHRPGRVLLYAAEDSPLVVRRRIQGIAMARGITLESLNIEVITSSRLRLDRGDDIEALDATVAMLKPRLLILDPFVRLHRIDENSSSEVANVLESLRYMQRKYSVSILVVHHAKKGAGSTRAGQALRGSSEFHAWGDSNLYMRRGSGGQLTLSVEHRAAASIDNINLTLTEIGDKLSLEIKDHNPIEGSQEKTMPAQKIEQALASSSPMVLSTLREACGIRMETLCKTLKTLIDAGRVTRDDDGYKLPASPL